MITFLLPGFSAHNKEWVNAIAQNLKVEGEVRPVYWDHWTDSDKTLKPKEKAQDIVDVAMGEPINIVAKSVGTLVAAYVAGLAPNQINKIILCGIPSVSDKRLAIYKETFSKIEPNKISVIQNTDDPFATASAVKDFMNKVNPKITVISKQASDHNYPYFADFQRLLS